MDLTFKKDKPGHREKYLSIITKNVVTASEFASAKEISCMMKENDIGAVVISRDEKVVGIVSERDVARRIVADGHSPDTTRACDFMTTDVISVQLKDGLNNIYKTLCEIRFRHLLIMDGDKLIGITSIRDFVDTLTCAKKR